MSRNCYIRSANELNQQWYKFRHICQVMSNSHAVINMCGARCNPMIFHSSEFSLRVVNKIFAPLIVLFKRFRTFSILQNSSKLPFSKIFFFLWIEFIYFLNCEAFLGLNQFSVLQQHLLNTHSTIFYFDISSLFHICSTFANEINFVNFERMHGNCFFWFHSGRSENDSYSYATECHASVNTLTKVFIFELIYFVAYFLNEPESFPESTKTWWGRIS